MSADFFLSSTDTVEIPVRNSRPMIVDATDAEMVSRHKWRLDKDAYAMTTVSLPDGKRTTLYSHRLILSAAPGQECDHINGDKLDNRSSNLRFATRRENTCNRRKQKSNTSGYIGVHWNKECRKWRAGICANGKKIHLGYFTDPADAATVYNFAAEQYHGEFAVFNEAQNNADNLIEGVK
jgi:hypothetical protein